MWALAGSDFEKALRVWDWPLRDALRALLEKCRADDVEEYHVSLVLYAIAAQWNPKAKKPDLPPLLREIARGR